MSQNKRTMNSRSQSERQCCGSTSSRLDRCRVDAIIIIISKPHRSPLTTNKRHSSEAMSSFVARLVLTTRSVLHSEQGCRSVLRGTMAPLLFLESVQGWFLAGESCHLLFLCFSFLLQLHFVLHTFHYKILDGESNNLLISPADATTKTPTFDCRRVLRSSHLPSGQY